MRSRDVPLGLLEIYMHKFYKILQKKKCFIYLFVIIIIFLKSIEA